MLLAACSKRVGRYSLKPQRPAVASLWEILDHRLSVKKVGHVVPLLLRYGGYMLARGVGGGKLWG